MYRELSLFDRLLGAILLAFAFGTLFAPSAIAQSGVVAGKNKLASDYLALRLVDDRAGPGDDQVRVSSSENGLPDALWLKRDGAIAGEVFVNARVDNDAVTRQPIVRVQLTPSAG